MFTYPKKLISEIKKTWNNKIHHLEVIPKLPSDPILERLLDVSYHASFKTEENRKIGFRLILCTADEIKEWDPQFFLRCPHSEPVRFEKPLNFTENDIMRLAPATDLTKVLICVRQSKKNYKDISKALEIWGLLDTGSSWWDFFHGESSEGSPPPNFLAISSTEPGNLSISRHGLIVLSLRNGQIMTPAKPIMFEGPISDFFQPAKKAIEDEVYELLKLDKENYEDSDEMESAPKRDYIEYLQRILFHVREKGHGGSIIFVPDYIEKNDSRLRDRIIIKYPCEYSRGWDLLVKSVVVGYQYFELHEKFWEDKENIKAKDSKRLQRLQYEKDELENALSDSVKFIAALTGVDGAVVITDRLSVIGFGAEVIAMSPTLVKIKVAKDQFARRGSKIPIETYGTRHRSAFRFCSSYEDSAAFVVSQDGGVRAIRRVGKDLVIWPDINYGTLGI